MKKAWIYSFLMMMIIALLAGCNAENADSPAKQEPVTISILNWNGLTEDEFDKFYLEPVSKHLPHITLKLAGKESGEPADAIAKHVMSGEMPDLIYVSNKDINHFINAEVVYNLEELVKKNQFDLDRFMAPAVESVMKPEVGLAAIPWAQNIGLIVYNKDIFDQFGVQYPKDLMTWEEMIPLARNLTRLVDNVQYLGFKPSSMSQFAQSLSVSYVSPEGKALVDTPTWHRILNFYKDLYAIPGYKEDYSGTFFGTKTVAMEAQWISTVLIQAESAPDVNWDVIGLPNFEERLGIGREVDAHTLAVSITSEHKEQALQVIQVVTSDEVQSKMSRYGRAPVLDDDQILSNYGGDRDYMAGKNWEAVFAVTPGELRENATVHDSMILRIINPLAERIRNGETDINTMLREVQQEADSALQAAMN